MEGLEGAIESCTTVDLHQMFTSFIVIRKETTRKDVLTMHALHVPR